MDLDDRIEAANRNVVDAFDRLRICFGDPRGARRRFGAVEALAVGHEWAFFNPVLALDRDAATGDVLAAFGWIESLGLPASVVVDSTADPSIGRALEERGLQAADERPAVMTLELDPSSGPTSGPIVASRPDGSVRSGGLELAEAWWSALEAGAPLRALFGTTLIADPAVRIAVAEHEGEPAAAAMAIRSDDIVGIYTVWTAERARRRGLGRAVTGAVIDAASAAWGSRLAILHSTAMGFPVYRSLGFEQVGSVVLYSRPRAATV